MHGKLTRGTGTLTQPVCGIFTRENIWGREVVYTEIVPECHNKTLQAIIKGKVDISSTITPDGWRGYDGLVDTGYHTHFRVNHSKHEFALKGTDGATVTVHGIESFWSCTKRRLAKFNGYTKYCELHWKECEWR